MKRTIHCLLAAVLLLAGASHGTMPPASAQEVAPPAPPSSLETAPVTIDGGFLFHLRGVSAYSAGDRAQVVMQRIRNVARDPAVTREMIVVKALPDRSDIVAGNMLIVSIFDVDAELEGVDRPLLAEAVLQQVRGAVEQYRRDRSPRSSGHICCLCVRDHHRLCDSACCLLPVHAISQSLRRSTASEIHRPVGGQVVTDRAGRPGLEAASCYSAELSGSSSL